MFAPRARHGLHIPREAITVALGVIASLVVILLWAAFMARSTQDETLGTLAPVVAASSSSAVYSVAEQGRDAIYISDPGREGPGLRRDRLVPDARDDPLSLVPCGRRRA